MLLHKVALAALAVAVKVEKPTKFLKFPYCEITDSGAIKCYN